MSSDDGIDQISVAVNINKQFEATENIDPSKDLCKYATLNKENISLEKLKEDIIIAFAASKAFKLLFEDDISYDWKIYSYASSKADIELQDDDDLEEEVDECCPSDDDSDDDDNLRKPKCMKLRVVFVKKNQSMLCKEKKQNAYDI